MGEPSIELDPLHGRLKSPSTIAGPENQTGHAAQGTSLLQKSNSQTPKHSQPFLLTISVLEKVSGDSY